MHLNQDFALAASHLTGEYCRTNRKLILACDMDETLLTESEDEAHFIMRPKVLFLLRNLKIFYELCLITYSTRDRTEQILRLKLDPTGRLFKGRVLCREDMMCGFVNKQDALLAHLPQSKNADANHQKPKRARSGPTIRPPAWPYVVILDDFPAAWSNFPTVVPIRPFIVGAANKVTVSGRPIPKVLAGECGYILSMYKFLCKLHSAVFLPNPKLFFENPDTGKSKKLSKSKCNSNLVRPPYFTAYSMMSGLRKKVTSAQRFQNLVYLDPGSLLCFESRNTPVLGEKRSQSMFLRKISTSPTPVPKKIA